MLLRRWQILQVKVVTVMPEKAGAIVHMSVELLALMNVQLWTVVQGPRCVTNGFDEVKYMFSERENRMSKITFIANPDISQRIIG